MIVRGRGATAERESGGSMDARLITIGIAVLVVIVLAWLSERFFRAQERRLQQSYRGDFASVKTRFRLVRRVVVTIVVLVAVVPVASVLLYQLLGNPAAMKAQAPVAAERSQFSEQDVRAMVDKLAERMKTNPDDPKGWILLARSYAALGRYAESSDAFAEAAKRLPDDAQLYADWADAAAMAQQRKLVGKPEELIARALKIDPNNRKALALSATALLERGDVNGSLARWRELKQKLAPDSDEAREIEPHPPLAPSTPRESATASSCRCRLVR